VEVPVSATNLVQVFDKDIALANDEVIRQGHSEERSQEDTVPVQELQEARGSGKDLPRTDAHSEDIAHPHATADVEPSREQRHEVRAERNHIGPQLDQSVSVDEDDVDDRDPGSTTMAEIVIKHIMIQVPPA
jgi:hypothetical protein